MNAMTSPALQHALDRIDAEFGIEAFHANRKKRVRRVMRLFPDYESELRYRWLAVEAQSCRLDLDQFLLLMDRAHRLNVKTGRAVQLYGRGGRMLNAETLFVVRSVLRWLRRYQPSQFQYVVGALVTPMREAAE